MDFFQSHTLDNFDEISPSAYVDAVNELIDGNIDAQVENEVTLKQAGFPFLAEYADDYMNESPYAVRIATESWSYPLNVRGFKRKMMVRRRIVTDHMGEMTIRHEVKILIAKGDERAFNAKRSIEAQISVDQFERLVSDKEKSYSSVKTRLQYTQGDLSIDVDFTGASADLEVDVTSDLIANPPEQAAKDAVQLIESMYELRASDNYGDLQTLATYELNMALHEKPNNRFAMRAVPKPINISLNNLTNGGIASPLYESSGVNSDLSLVGGAVQYAVSCKSDGEHAFLLIVLNMAFLVNMSGMVLAFFLLDEDFDGMTVLEGELVGTSFILFDSLKVEGDDITDYDYIRRVSIGRQFMDKNQINGLTFAQKSIVSLTDDFSAEMKSILDRCAQSQFGNDGLIFTPIHANYFKQSSDFPIYKWKPLDLLTIDVRYEDGNVYVGKKVNGRITDAPLDTIWPRENGFALDIPNDVTSGVLEMRIELHDNRPDTLRFFRRRSDKVNPNKDSTVLAIIRLHEQPISKETLTGTSNQKLRRHHNMIKRYGFQLTANQQARLIAGTTNKRVLLDLGGGRGGDISKWRDAYDKVYVVEPNRDNAQEFRRRLARMDTATARKVIILETGAEDTATIQDAMGNDKATTVAMMLSLTFFAGRMLEQLANTIRTCTTDQYELLVVTMDRNRFRKYEKQVVDKTLANTTISLRDDGRIQVHIEDSIVTNQTENLVSISDLLTALGQKELASASDSLAHEDRSDNSISLTSGNITALPIETPIMLLSDEEALINSLYVAQLIEVTKRRAENADSSKSTKELTVPKTKSPMKRTGRMNIPPPALPSPSRKRVAPPPLPASTSKRRAPPALPSSSRTTPSKRVAPPPLPASTSKRAVPSPSRATSSKRVAPPPLPASTSKRAVPSPFRATPSKRVAPPALPASTGKRVAPPALPASTSKRRAPPALPSPFRATPPKRVAPPALPVASPKRVAPPPAPSPSRATPPKRVAPPPLPASTGKRRAAAADATAAALQQQVQEREIGASSTIRKPTKKTRTATARTIVDQSISIIDSDELQVYRVGTINHQRYPITAAILQAVSTDFARVGNRTQTLASYVQKIGNRKTDEEIAQETANRARSRIVFLRQIGTDPSQLEYVRTIEPKREAIANVYIVQYGSQQEPYFDLIAVMMPVEVDNIQYTVLVSKLFYQDHEDVINELSGRYG